LNPNFLLAHRKLYLEGMGDGQMTPRGYPDFNSYAKNLHVSIGKTDRQTDEDINLGGGCLISSSRSTVLNYRTLTYIISHKRSRKQEIQSRCGSSILFYLINLKKKNSAPERNMSGHDFSPRNGDFQQHCGLNSPTTF
jgi:hypothetical protein